MSDDSKVEVQFGGSTQGLEQAAGRSATLIGRFADAAREAAGKVKSAWGSMGPLFGGVSGAIGEHLSEEGASHLGAFGSIAVHAAGEIKEHWEKLPPVFKTVAGAAGLALVAIGALMAGKHFVEHTAEETESLRDLARALGITTNEASAYRALLEDLGASESEFTGLAKGLVRQLKEHEAAMNKAGLATRDAAGHLKPMPELVLDAVEALGKYREGTDRNIASTVFFGRSMDASSRIMLANREALVESAKAVRELHLEVGEASTAAWNDFDRASDRAALTLKGIGKAIGDSLMPVITELTDWFNSIGPAAITVIRGALGGLATAFLGLTNGLVILWEAFKAVVFSLTDPLVRLGTALTQLATGDVKGATQTMMDIPKSIGARWGMMWEEVAAASQRTSDRIKNMWGWATGGESKPGDKGGPGTGTKGGPTEPGKAEKLPESYMAYYEAVLSEQKRVYSLLNAGRQMSKQEELAYWQAILSIYRTTTADTTSIVKKTADLEVAIEKEKLERSRALSEEDIGHEERMAEVALAAARTLADQEVSLGRLTKDQLAVAEEEFESRRFDIKMRALAQRLELLDPEMDPVKYRQLKNQIEEAEQDHQAKMAEIRGAAAVEQAQRLGQVWEDFVGRMGSLWDQGVDALMNGTFRWSNAFRAVGAQIVGWFASSIVKPIVMQWAFGETAKTGATATGTAARSAMETLAAAKSVALWAATAVKNIMTSAWEAMAGAYKAIVGIPYVGPFLAPAMAAVAFVGVSKLASNVMSAEQGFDIPAGVNPLVQAHEQEMILPKDIAQPMREMATGGGGGPTPTLNVMRHGNMYYATQDEFIRFFKHLQTNRYIR